MLTMGKKETIVSSCLHLLSLSVQVAAHPLKASEPDNHHSTTAVVTKIVQRTTVQRYDSENPTFANVQDTNLRDGRTSLSGEQPLEALSLSGFSWPRPSTRISSTKSQKPTESTLVKISESSQSEVSTALNGEVFTTLGVSIPTWPKIFLHGREIACWKLRVQIALSESLLDLYMSTPQAAVVCDNLPEDESASDEVSVREDLGGKDDAETYYELQLGEGDIAANIKIPAEDAIAFCADFAMWVDKERTTRSSSVSRKTTRTTTKAKSSVAVTSSRVRSETWSGVKTTSIGSTGSQGTDSTSSTTSNSTRTAHDAENTSTSSKGTTSTHLETSRSTKTSSDAKNTTTLSSDMKPAPSSRPSSSLPPLFADDDFFTLYSSVQADRDYGAATSMPPESEGEQEAIPPSATHRILTIALPPPQPISGPQTLSNADTLTEPVASPRPSKTPGQSAYMPLFPPSPLPLSSVPSDAPSASPTKPPLTKPSSSAAWGKINDPRIVWTVVFGWTLLGLQVAIGGWEFVRNVKGEAHVGLRILRMIRGLFAYGGR